MFEPHIIVRLQAVAREKLTEAVAIGLIFYVFFKKNGVDIVADAAPRYTPIPVFPPAHAPPGEKCSCRMVLPQYRLVMRIFSASSLLRLRSD